MAKTPIPWDHYAALRRQLNQNRFRCLLFSCLDSPLPVEIVQYAHEHVRRQLEALPSLATCKARLRRAEAGRKLSPDGHASKTSGDFYVTDNGNYIVDLHFRCVQQS